MALKFESIYIKRFVRQSVSQSVTFCLFPGDKQFVGGTGGHDDDKEMVVSKASKLSAGARIFRGP